LLELLQGLIGNYSCIRAGACHHFLSFLGNRWCCQLCWFRENCSCVQD